KVGNYYVLSRREIRTETEGNISIQEFIFGNLELLG
ncbi:MAG: DUF3386 family protein, partial [Sphaerospermopsis kisseleviana]